MYPILSMHIYSIYAHQFYLCTSFLSFACASIFLVLPDQQIQGASRCSYTILVSCIDIRDGETKHCGQYSIVCSPLSLLNQQEHTIIRSLRIILSSPYWDIVISHLVSKKGSSNHPSPFVVDSNNVQPQPKHFPYWISSPSPTGAVEQ
jgi:hypothetical protein